MVKLNLNKIIAIFIVMSFFFATWGEGLQHLPFALSKFFTYLMSVIIGLAAFSLFNVKLNLPKQFKLLVGYIIFHTLIFICLHPEMISFGIQDDTAIQGDFVRTKENEGNLYLRFFLLCAFSCILTRYLLKYDYLLKRILLFYCIGFCLSLFLGGYSMISGGGMVRFAAGYLDPNAMGISAALSSIFALYLIKRCVEKKYLFFLYLIFITSSIALLVSFSRGAILSVFIALLVYMFKKLSLKLILKYALVLFFCSIAFSFFIDESIKEIIQLRFSVEQAKEDKGAGRLDIWDDYVSNIGNFIVIGTGMNNETSAIKDNYKYQLKSTHNQYLLYFVNYGILGFSFFLFYLISILKQISILQNRDDFLLSLSFVIILVSMLTIDLDKSRDYWIVLSILNYLYMKNVMLKKNKPNENSDLQPIILSR